MSRTRSTVLVEADRLPSGEWIGEVWLPILPEAISLLEWLKMRAVPGEQSDE